MVFWGAWGGSTAGNPTQGMTLRVWKLNYYTSREPPDVFIENAYNTYMVKGNWIFR